MKDISVADDIVPIGEFKASLSKWIKRSKSSGHPIVVTQNGRPATEVLSPTDYDRLNEIRQFVDSMQRGLTDADNKNVYNTEQLENEIERRRNKKANQ